VRNEVIIETRDLHKLSSK